MDDPTSDIGSGERGSGGSASSHIGTARQGPTAAAPLLTIDDDLFTAHFDRYPFTLTHALQSHPLLQLPRLVRLAQDIGGPILSFSGDHAINQVDDDAPSTVAAAGEATTPGRRTFADRHLDGPELSAAETVAQIERCNAWMQLRDVGRDPEYAELLSAIITEFQAHADRVSPGLSAPRADIFVSSPGATTPFHLDEEHNFLLQIRGSKRLSIADGTNPHVLSAGDVRSYFDGSGELARYSERLEEHSVHVDLAAGEGVHIPPLHPHWVQNGDAVSISLGILWYSDVTARRRHLYRVNKVLERVGLHPPPPGTRPVSDAVKALPLTVKRRAKRIADRRADGRSARPANR